MNTPGKGGKILGVHLPYLQKITIDNVEAIFPILSLGTPGSQVQTTSENIVKILYVFNNFGLETYFVSLEKTKRFKQPSSNIY